MVAIYLDSIEATVSVKETKEEREARIREEITTVIVEFKKGDGVTYSFPSTLNSYERMLVHQVSLDTTCLYNIFIQHIYTTYTKCCINMLYLYNIFIQHGVFTQYVQSVVIIQHFVQTVEFVQRVVFTPHIYVVFILLIYMTFCTLCLCNNFIYCSYEVCTIF